MRLRLTSRAARDLTGIAKYIEQESPAAARRVVLRIERTLRLIRRSPLVGRPSVRSNTHEFPVSGLPLLIVYRIVGDTVEVLTIFHTSRDPEARPS